LRGWRAEVHDARRLSGTASRIARPVRRAWTSPASRRGGSGNALEEETSVSGLRRAAVALGIVVVLVVLAGAGVAYAFFRTFYPSPPAARYPPAADAAAAQRQDLDYFRHYFELNRSYAPAAGEQALGLLAEAEARAGAFSPAQFDLAVSRMVALADNGHSRVHPGPLSRRYGRLPCRLYRFADGYRVLRARPACTGLLGARVLALDGHAVDEVAERMYPYFGGPRNHYEQFAAVFFLESPALLHAAGLAEAPDRLELRAQLQDGSERTLTLAADPADADAPRVYSDRYLSPQRIEGEAADWTPLLPPDAALPLFLRDYDTPFRTENLPQPGLYYVQLRSNADEPGHPIGAFVERVRREAAERQPSAIVLDLRLDQGGNFTKTASLMQDMATLAPSVRHVYVLTGAWTFSAGNLGLALVKTHGAGKVTVVGEPVGDRIRMWAEGGTLTLPNSKLAIGFATGLHDYRRPCTGEPGCFWILRFYPTQVESLEPDVRVPYTFDDYVHLRDPQLDAAVALALRGG
jgi:hypothetical protein